MAGLPLSVTVPAAAASFAYVNAKIGLSSDIWLLSQMIRSLLAVRGWEVKDQHNAFYLLESRALDPTYAPRPFLVFEGKVWTYSETYDTILRYGTWLQKVHHVAPEEVVGLDSMNSPEFIFCWFGLWSIGAKPAFINYNLTGEPLLHSVKAANSRLLLVAEEARDCFPAATLERLSSPQFLEEGGSTVVVFLGDVAHDILATQPVRLPDKVRAGQKGSDLAMLIYTSGTTGLPKPAVVSWAKLSRARYFVSRWLSLTKEDRFYTAMPLYHSSASILGFGATLEAGAAFLFDKKFGRTTFWQTIREQNATVFQYVGETCRYLLSAPPSPLDAQHQVRCAFGNGLRPDIWETFKTRFAIPTIAEFYAATEGTFGSWNLSRNSFSSGAVGRNGKLAYLLVGSQVRMIQVDINNDQPVRHPVTGFCLDAANNEPGELLYKLPEKDIESQFRGYYRNKKATESKILRNVFRKGDAWFRTGDLIRYDHEGRQFFHDRIGDTFRWKSENVSTSEVAEALGRHPAVQEANVYGVQLPKHDGRAGCAAVVLKGVHAKEGPRHKTFMDVDESVLRDIAKYITKALPRYAVPLFLRFTHEIEKTGTNKQMKTQLRAQGVDPKKTVPTGDRVYWLQGDRYKEFTEKDWSAIGGGKVRL